MKQQKVMNHSKKGENVRLNRVQPGVQGDEADVTQMGKCSPKTEWNNKPHYVEKEGGTAQWQHRIVKHEIHDQSKVI